MEITKAVVSLSLLDCFCGLGGASEGFHREGFDCTGIDIVNVGYPYKFIQGDMRELDGADFKGYDVIWGSPPCRDFSVLTSVGKSGWGPNGEGKWKNPPNEHRGLVLVHSFLAFVREAQPKIWIMENVPGLAKHLQIKPKVKARLTKGMRRDFYGNFPDFLMPSQKEKGARWLIGGKLRSWKRAKIPLACSLAFARACKEALK